MVKQQQRPQPKADPKKPITKAESKPEVQASAPVEQSKPEGVETPQPDMNVKTEPPTPTAKEAKSLLAFGIHGEFTVVDSKEFRKLVISITRGYTKDYDGLGMTMSLQKLFHLKEFADAKALHILMQKS